MNCHKCILCFHFLFLASAITLALPKLSNITDVHAGRISLSSTILTQKGQSGFRAGFSTSATSYQLVTNQFPTTLCLRKNAPTLKRYSSKLSRLILMAFGRNIQNTLE